MKSKTLYTAAAVMLGLLCALYYLEYVARNLAIPLAREHALIVEGTATSPYRYRILSAGLVEALRVVIPGDPVVSVSIAYTTGYVIAFVLMFVFLYRWFARWMTADRAAVGMLIIAALMPLGLLNWGVSLYTPIEIAFVALAGLLAIRKPTPILRVTYGLLVITATMNRETGGLLALLYVLAHWRNRREWTAGAVYVVLYGAVYGGLRVILGHAPNPFTVDTVWAANTGYWFSTAIRNTLFMLPIWVVALMRWKRANPCLRRLALVLLVYMPMVVLFAQWHEIRLHFVPFTLLIPIALTDQ